ncbi:hypothetical protein [Nitrolancea hollandica]|uniref:Uncharacterized protein n=1 Tax=Nitrolancea hollandica Lb TaxID=1129897 RepID=I4EKZ7_9BACT|nr:hypothetical protein [Nitrolancea hollandica]CCF85359.1 hypothetical protein NITHO_4880004 [Nitrolancea hollandica Lb]
MEAYARFEVIRYLRDSVLVSTGEGPEFENVDFARFLVEKHSRRSNALVGKVEPYEKIGYRHIYRASVYNDVDPDHRPILHRWLKNGFDRDNACFPVLKEPTAVWVE